MLTSVEGRMGQDLYRQYCELIYDRAGIRLGRNKEPLVCARVSKRMRLLGLQDFALYLELVQTDSRGGELVELLNAVSTNTTHFFREPAHFDFFAETLARWEEEGRDRFRIWSTASSTGEEPYSLAITALESFASQVDCRILATDISTRVLDRAKSGVYRAELFDRMPRRLRNRYFFRCGDGPGPEGQDYRVTPQVREMIRFARLNLAAPPFPMQGPMDMIFCRNVMIYFDKTVRQALLAEIRRLLRPGGYLVVGHSESLAGLASDFRAVKPSIYQYP